MKKMKKTIEKVMILAIILIIVSCEKEDMITRPDIGHIQVSAPSGLIKDRLILFKIPLQNTTSADEVSIVWDFGDGMSASGQEVTHRYTDDRDYTVRVIVANDAGEVEDVMILIIASDSQIVVGNQAGSIIFWARGYNISLPIEVYTQGQMKKITTTYNSSTPSCGSTGVAQWNGILYGGYTFHAIDAAGVSWQGTYIIDEECNSAQLIIN